MIFRKIFSTFLIIPSLFLVISSCSGKKYKPEDGERIFSYAYDLQPDPRLAGAYIEPQRIVEDACMSVTDFDYQNAGISMDSYPIIKLDTYKINFARDGDFDFYLHPIICNNMVYNISNDGDVTAYSLKDRRVKKLWTEKPLTYAEKKYHITSNARLEDNILYIATSRGFVIALDVDTREIKWKKHFDASFNASPTLNDDLLYLISEKDEVLAINKDNGDLVWKFEEERTEKTRSFQIPPVAVFDNSVVAGLSNGTLLVLDTSGNVKWKQKILPARSEVEDISDIDFPPVLYNGVLVAGGIRTSIMGFDFKTGNPLWQIPTGLNSYLMVNDQGFGFFVSKDNENVCFLIQNGLIKCVKQHEKSKYTAVPGYINSGKKTKVQSVSRYFDSY